MVREGTKVSEEDDVRSLTFLKFGEQLSVKVTEKRKAVKGRMFLSCHASSVWNARAYRRCSHKLYDLCSCFWQLSKIVPFIHLSSE